MTRQVLVHRCQGWDVKKTGMGDVLEPVQCENPATQDGVRCPFHWGQKPVEWMLVTIDD